MVAHLAVRWLLPALRYCVVAVVANSIVAIPSRGEETPKSGAASTPLAAAGKVSDDNQAARETALSQMLSGATLEGSFTDTAQTKNVAKIDREKYTLGEVKKLAGDVWQFPARIEYGGKDVTLPILLPVKWAGDTPVVVVDTVDLPGFGAVSARVLFFEGHYAGYWKHGEHSGNLFGLIHLAGNADGKAAKAPVEKNASAQQETQRVSPSSGSKPPGREQPQQ